MSEQTSISVFGYPGWEADGDGELYRNGEKVICHKTHGYDSVTPGKKATLVCTAWHGPKPFDGARVRHLNDVRTDDRPVNLAWGTHSDDALDAYRNGNRVRPKGELNSSAKLTEEDVLEIRSKYASGGYSYADLAYIYSVHRITIRDIVKRHHWGHI